MGSSNGEWWVDGWSIKKNVGIPTECNKGKR